MSPCWLSWCHWYTQMVISWVSASTSRVKKYLLMVSNRSYWIPDKFKQGIMWWNQLVPRLLFENNLPDRHFANSKIGWYSQVLCSTNKWLKSLFYKVGQMSVGQTVFGQKSWSLLTVGVEKQMSLSQGTLKGEVSLYCWPPVWLVWNQLYDRVQFLFLYEKKTNPNRSKRRSTVQWYFPL
jgi:hypothetical protein